MISIPLITAPYQIDDFCPIFTLPIIVAESATNEAFITGVDAPNLTHLAEGITVVSAYAKYFWRH